MLAKHPPQHAKIDQANIDADVGTIVLYERRGITIRDDFDAS